MYSIKIIDGHGELNKIWFYMPRSKYYDVGLQMNQQVGTGTLFSKNTSKINFLTSMKSSLDSNSDTTTFLRSYTLVNEMNILPDALMWASSGISLMRPSVKILWMLKLGWRGPNVRDRALVTTPRILSVIFPVKVQGGKHKIKSAKLD